MVKYKAVDGIISVLKKQDHNPGTESDLHNQFTILVQAANDYSSTLFANNLLYFL